MHHRLPLLLAATALVVAVLGATPVAGAVRGLVLPANSVGTVHLKPNAVTSGKINNGSVGALDIARNAIVSKHVKDSSLLAADFKPGQLPAGPKGDKGEPGATRVVFHRDQAALSLGGIANAIAVCGPGEKLVGGGGALLRAGDTISSDPNVHLVASYPATAGITAPADGEAGTRWVAIALADEPSSTRVVASRPARSPDVHGGEGDLAPVPAILPFHSRRSATCTSGSGPASSSARSPSRFRRPRSVLDAHRA